MTDEEVTIFPVHLDPENTTLEGWLDFAGKLESSGAGEDQLAMMRMMYFLGAMQTYSRLRLAAMDKDYPAFMRLMERVEQEIEDEVRPHKIAGHA